MSEPEEIDEDYVAPVCRMPDCPGDILTTWRGETWCVNHAADDWLPDLVRAPFMVGCAVCGSGTIYVTRDDDTVGLHPHCVRRWVVGAGNTEAAPEMPVEPVGAYARRRAAG